MVNRSAASAGAGRSSPSVTSEKLTVALGNSETVASPRIAGSRPVAPRISMSTAWRTRSGGISREAKISAAIPAANTAAIARDRRSRPVADGTA